MILLTHLVSEKPLGIIGSVYLHAAVPILMLIQDCQSTEGKTICHILW